MHELSLVSSILERIAPLVTDPSKLRKVMVTLGPLSGICQESLEFGFRELAQCDGFRNAELVVNAVQAQLRCGSCAALYATDHLHEPCPACGSLERTVLNGAQFTLDSIEVEA